MKKSETELVFLLEEKSAEAMLKVIVPKLLPRAEFKCIAFEGKSHLDKKLESRLTGYRKPGAMFLVLRDKDSSNCKRLKHELLGKVPNHIHDSRILLRIACHELESFYLGDLSAVEKGMGINLSNERNQPRYQNPDTLANSKQELIKLTKNKYQPIAGSRAIAAYLDLSGNNRSRSFNVLIDGIKKLGGI